MLRMASLNKEMETLVKVRYANTVAANRIKEDVSEATRSMLNVLIMTRPGPDQEGTGEHGSAQRQASAAVARTGQEHAATPRATEILKALAVIQDKFLPAQTRFISLVNEDKKDEAMMKFMFSLRPQQTRYFEQLDKFIAYQNAAMQQAGRDAAAVTQRTQMLILALAERRRLLSLGVACWPRAASPGRWRQVVADRAPRRRRRPDAATSRSTAATKPAR